MKHTGLLMFCALLVALPAAARAGNSGHGRHHDRQYYEPRSNHDNHRAHTMPAYGIFDFAAADRNSDGVVSYSEKRNYLRYFEDDYRDSYGRHGAATALSRINHEYNMADENRDGRLTLREYRNYQQYASYQPGRTRTFYYRTNRY